MLDILPPCLSLCDTRYDDVYAEFHDSGAMDDFWCHFVSNLLQYKPMIVSIKKFNKVVALIKRCNLFCLIVSLTVNPKRLHVFTYQAHNLHYNLRLYTITDSINQ